MDLKDNKYKTVSVVLIVGICIFLLFSLFTNYGGKKFFKRLIKDNNKKIEVLDLEQVEILKQMRQDSILLIKKNKEIYLLKYKQKQLLDTIKIIKNENERIKNDYLNNSINERIILFSKLGVGHDTKTD